MRKIERVIHSDEEYCIAKRSHHPRLLGEGGPGFVRRKVCLYSFCFFSLCFRRRRCGCCFGCRAARARGSSWKVLL